MIVVVFLWWGTQFRGIWTTLLKTVMYCPWAQESNKKLVNYGI